MDSWVLVWIAVVTTATSLSVSSSSAIAHEKLGFVQLREAGCVRLGAGQTRKQNESRATYLALAKIVQKAYGAKTKNLDSDEDLAMNEAISELESSGRLFDLKISFQSFEKQPEPTLRNRFCAMVEAKAFAGRFRKQEKNPPNVLELSGTVCERPPPADQKPGADGSPAARIQEMIEKGKNKAIAGYGMFLRLEERTNNFYLEKRSLEVFEPEQVEIKKVVQAQRFGMDCVDVYAQAQARLRKVDLMDSQASENVLEDLLVEEKSLRFNRKMARDADGDDNTEGLDDF